MRTFAAQVLVLAVSLLTLTNGLVIEERQSGGCKCAGRSFDSTNLEDAIEKARSGGVRSYPHIYRNYEHFDFDNCSGTLYEFPIFPDSTYNGGPPGPDRIIYDSEGQFCACVTHTGAPKRNAFVGCK